MALIKRKLSTILDSFQKPVTELNLFIDEQRERQRIANNNIDKLVELQNAQDDIALDAATQIHEAESARSTIFKAFPFLTATK